MKRPDPVSVVKLFEVDLNVRPDFVFLDQTLLEKGVAEPKPSLPACFMVLGLSE